MTKVMMPEPVILRTVMPDDYRYGHVYGFTRRQVEAYADARVRETLEEVLEVADKYNEFSTYDAIKAMMYLLSENNTINKR